MGPPPSKRARPVASAAVVAGGEAGGAVATPAPRPSLAPSTRGNGAGAPPAVGSKRLRDSGDSSVGEA